MPNGIPASLEDAHTSRHGRAATEPNVRHTSITDRDTASVLKDGFFPPLELLEARHLTFKGVDELIQEQERHLEQCRTATDKISQLHARFRQEDADREGAVREAFARGTSPSRVKPPATSADERNRLLAEAERDNRLAHEVAWEWAQEALETARGRTVNWETSILETQAATRTQIEELNARLDALKAELAADTALQNWVNRLTTRHPGTLMSFADFAAINPPPPRTDPKQMGPYGQAAWRKEMIARGLSADIPSDISE